MLMSSAPAFSRLVTLRVTRNATSVAPNRETFPMRISRLVFWKKIIGSLRLATKIWNVSDGPHYWMMRKADGNIMLLSMPTARKAIIIEINGKNSHALKA